MKISIPFLATEEAQLVYPEKFNNHAVEAVIFNRSDLCDEKWLYVWQLIERACEIYSAYNVTFHFPVNDSDYVSDNFVYSRLMNAYERASDLGLNGVVVHSNRIRRISEWKNIALHIERRQVIDALVAVKNRRLHSNTWLALENMPVMDNFGVEIDPLFCFPSDFSLMQDTDLGIVWDICHYTSTLANMAELRNNKQSSQHYPNIQEAELLDFVKLKNKIVHWHFSAFRGIANPDTGKHCQEGVIPKDSTLGEDIYKKCLLNMLDGAFPSKHMVLEIAELDYTNRLKAPQVIDWIYQAIGRKINFETA